jgi:hypothetical protein
VAAGLRLAAGLQLSLLPPLLYISAPCIHCHDYKSALFPSGILWTHSPSPSLFLTFPFNIIKGPTPLTRTWIVFNQPTDPDYSHAGLLLALGLTGHIEVTIIFTINITTAAHPVLIDPMFPPPKI